MNKIPLILIIILLGAGTYYAIKSGPTPNPSSAESVFLERGTPTLEPLPNPTVTETPLPPVTATPDPLIFAQQTQAQAAVNLALSLGTATMASITQQAVETRQAELERLRHATQTESARVTQTVIASELGTQAANATATIQAPITRRLEVEADWEPFWQVTWIIGVIFLVLIVALCLVRLTDEKLKVLYAERAVYQQSTARAPEPIGREPLVTIQETRLNDGYLEATLHDLPAGITATHLQKVAELLLTQRLPFSRATLVDGPRKCLTDGEWDKLRAWLGARGYAKQVNPEQSNSPWTLTRTGESFFKTFL